MKKWMIKVAVLLVIFFVTLTGAALYLNRGETENVRDFGTPTLPVAYMDVSGTMVNRMYGYRQEMDGTTMRFGLTPLSTDRQLTFQMNDYGKKIKSVTYEVTSTDGTELIENSRIQSLKDNGSLKEATFQLQQPILMNQEYLIRFTVNIEGMDQPVYYYSRLVQRSGLDVGSYLTFVQSFYEKCISKDNAATEITSSLEPDATASNSSFNNVTIHSNFDQVTWGSMAPTIVKKPVPTISEVNETTTTISQEYMISAVDADGKTEYYTVKESYRMRYSQNRVILLDFDRSAVQFFDPELSVLTTTGINLGVVSKNVQYASNQGADIVAFVANGELWSYNRSANKCTRIFTFRNIEEVDERAEHMEHDIKIVRVAESGDVAFVVYGYMNSDDHEGMVGSAVYYYSAERNVTEEELFIPSTSAYPTLKQNLSVLSYVSTQNQFYMYLEGSLYQINLTDASFKILKDQISSDCFVVSKGQESVAWMDEMQENQSSHITVLSLETGKTLLLTAEEGRKIKALGFINQDFIYGVANDEDIVTDAAGNVTFGMNKLNIVNIDGTVVKEYAQDGIFVTGITIQEQDTLLGLKRVAKDENGGYVPTSDDHIMNNVQADSETVSTKLSVSDRKGTQILLTFTKTGKTTNLLSLTTKFVEHNTSDVLAIDIPKQDTERYYVYARGTLLKICSKVSDAIQTANDNMGVVLNQAQQYIWERGNQDSSKKLDTAEIPEGIRMAPLDEASIQGALGDGYTVMNMTGCPLSSILYQISHGYPVIAKTPEGGTVLIAGYDQYNTWLYDMNTQSLYAKAMDDSTTWFESAGNVFISYRADNPLS
ncbi:MAG: hypothetical protein PHG16_02875 [Lachnospiraceae bacterium]|nr:hypothetical protein [Lachnospiraceae bacterium]